MCVVLCPADDVHRGDRGGSRRGRQRGGGHGADERGCERCEQGGPEGLSDGRSVLDVSRGRAPFASYPKESARPFQTSPPAHFD